MEPEKSGRGAGWVQGGFGDRPPHDLAAETISAIDCDRMDEWIAVGRQLCETFVLEELE